MTNKITDSTTPYADLADYELLLDGQIHHPDLPPGLWAEIRERRLIIQLSLFVRDGNRSER